MKKSKTKICSQIKCIHNGKEQPITNFRVDNTKKDGLRTRCKDCDKIAEKNRKIKYITVETKICNRKGCTHNKEIQSIDNFWLDKTKRDGHRCYCKDCEMEINKFDRKEYFEEYRKNHKEEIQKYQQENIWKCQTPEFKEKKKIYNNSPARYFTFMINSNILEIFEDVRQDPNNEELIQVKCKNSKCDSWFNPTNAQVQRRLSSFNGTLETPGKQNYFYCCESCKDACSLFNYDSNQKQKKIRKKSIETNQICSDKFLENDKCTRHDALQTQLSSIVLEMDNYVCQMCGADKKENKEIILHCHHIIPFAIDLSLASDITNCITVCDNCHKLIHKNINNEDCSYKNISKNKKTKKTKVKS